METIELKLSPVDGSVLRQQGNGRYYSLKADGTPTYGYFTHLSGLWVCFTDGHYCDCECEE